MNNMTAVPVRTSNAPRGELPANNARLIILQALLAAACGVVLFCLVVASGLTAYQVVYAGRIYPGVRAGGVDVGGLSMIDAAQKLLRQADYARRGQLTLVDGAQTWQISPMEVGLFLDAETSAQRAYAVGRAGFLSGLLEQMRARRDGVELPLLMVFDQRLAFRYLESLTGQIDRPVIEAHLGITGTEVQLSQGGYGRSLDVSASLEQMGEQMKTLQNGAVPLVVVEMPPAILDASAQAEVARAILSQPLMVTMPPNQPDQKGPWLFDPPALAALLRLKKVDDAGKTRYEVMLDTEPLRAFLNEQQDALRMTPQNAHFTFNDQIHQLEVIQPSVTGRSLDIDASLRSIQEKSVKGEHSIALEFSFTPPAVTEQMTAEQLGIRELIQEQTTYFYGSSTPRIQNITMAASRFHGLMVPPGETFSAVQALGDISLDSGYAEGLIIYGNQTIKGVGGGVCQVSTTLFRTAFFAGFPVVERTPHAYRVSYYEKGPDNRIDPQRIGLDATVFAPVVDFKFKNDSAYWLLMETYVDEAARTITWKFYSTSDGRSVEWENTGPTHIVPQPEPLYKENPELKEGDIKQVDWGVDGADVNVQRTVSRNGEVYFKDTVYTHYLPWRDIFEYGPGTQGIPTPSPEKPTPVP